MNSVQNIHPALEHTDNQIDYVNSSNYSTERVSHYQTPKITMPKRQTTINEQMTSEIPSDALESQSNLINANSEDWYRPLQEHPGRRACNYRVVQSV